MSFLNSQGNSIDIKSKIERFCAFQERSTFEVRGKLVQWGTSDEDIAKLITHLSESNFLDDRRYAFAYVSGKFRIKKWGRIKIKLTLSAKGITKDLIQIALNEIDPEEYQQTLLLLAEKKYQELNKEKDKWVRRSKLQRFLASKGYELDFILDVIRLLDN
jgi:regulatory protein